MDAVKAISIVGLAGQNHAQTARMAHAIANRPACGESRKHIKSTKAVVSLTTGVHRVASVIPWSRAEASSLVRALALWSGACICGLQVAVGMHILCVVLLSC